jgi:hypothetical protein
MSKGRRVASAVAAAAVLLLIAIGYFRYQTMLLKSRESTLEVNLAALRGTIVQYTKDKHKPPQSLHELVDAGYFAKLPVDPMTQANGTWEPVIAGQGITDVHSGSTAISSKGTAYRAW